MLLRGIAVVLLSAAACSWGNQPPPAPPSPAQQAHASALYVNHCVICHGASGNGLGLRRAGFRKPPQDFTAPAWRGSATVEKVAGTIREGKRGTPMPAWPTLSSDEVNALAFHVLSFAEGDVR